MGNFKNHVRDWTSRKWHSVHNWKTGTGKLIKRTLNKRERKKTKEEETNPQLWKGDYDK
jgi:hypothetical protein|tara:strand:- start:149 stop:325 length:177 start_codon:yes stop_codon:yes gene_type:complete